MLLSCFKQYVYTKKVWSRSRNSVESFQTSVVTISNIITESQKVGSIKTRFEHYLNSRHFLKRMSLRYIDTRRWRKTGMTANLVTAANQALSKTHVSMNIGVLQQKWKLFNQRFFDCGDNLKYVTRKILGVCCQFRILIVLKLLI